MIFGERLYKLRKEKNISKTVVQMNEIDKQKLKELNKCWESCPSKKVTFILALLITFIAFDSVYDVGCAIGEFLYNIGV